MWNPFKRRSRAEVYSIVVKTDEGLHAVEYVISADDFDDATQAMEECFAAAVSRHRSNPDFGGDVNFIVYGASEPGAELAPELQCAQAQLERKIADARLTTSKGRPFRAKVTQKKSAL